MDFNDYELNEMWQEFLFMANLMSYKISDFTIYSERIHTTMKEFAFLKPNIIIKISIIMNHSLFPILRTTSLVTYN